MIETIIISITDACVLHCIGCYATKNMPRMKYEDFVKIIDKLPKTNVCADCGGIKEMCNCDSSKMVEMPLIRSITITGGEPFSHPDLKKILQYCTENYMKPRIVTSGCLPKSILANVSDYIDLLTVTVKYLDDIPDSLWRRGKGTFTKSKEFLIEGKRLGIPLSINWIADKQNIQNFYRMYKFASELDATLQVVRFIPYENALRIFALDDSEWEDLCDHASRFENVHIAFPSIIANKKGEGYIYCTAGTSRLYFRTDGSVCPCIYISEKIGNINDSFDTLMQRGEDWRQLNLSYKGKIIKGCIGYLKQTDPNYKNMVFDQQNVIKLMQKRGIKL